MFECSNLFTWYDDISFWQAYIWMLWCTQPLHLTLDVLTNLLNVLILLRLWATFLNIYFQTLCVSLRAGSILGGWLIFFEGINFCFFQFFVFSFCDDTLSLEYYENLRGYGTEIFIFYLLLSSTFHLPDKLFCRKVWGSFNNT